MTFIVSETTWTDESTASRGHGAMNLIHRS